MPCQSFQSRSSEPRFMLPHHSRSLHDAARILLAIFMQLACTDEVVTCSHCEKVHFDVDLAALMAKV